MASRPILRLLRSRVPQIRSFAQTSPFLAAKPPTRASQTIPKLGVKSKSAPKSAPKVAPTRSSRPSTAAPPPPRVAAPSQLPKPSLRSATSTPQIYASALLRNEETLLLYKGPRNIALFTSCFITGGALFFWVGSVANGTFLEYTVPWYGKAVVLAGCLVSSAIAIAVSMTPHHLIKTISLVRTGEKEVMLRVTGTRFFPFMKPAVFTIAPGELMVDKNVTMGLDDVRSWWRVPLESGKSWTESDSLRPGPSGNAFQRLNKRVLNIGPAMFSQTRKMFNREGMAYVRIGSSNWKMDLTDCEILEGGTILMKLAREGAVRTTLADMAMRSAFGK